MKNKYIYARESLKNLILISIIGLPFLAIGIYMILFFDDIDGKILGYSFLFTDFILVIILLSFLISKLKWRKWRRIMEQSNNIVNGKVVGFGYKYHHRRNNNSIEYHWLKVMYVDNLGNERIFETPTLAFRPEKRKDITCDVYICNHEVLATNFKNLNKRKFNWLGILVGVIFGAAIIGIAYIVYWFRS